MRIINKVNESKKIKEEQDNKQREQYQAKVKAQKESIIPTIKIIPDWRLMGEYNKYIKYKKIIVFAGLIKETERNYFKYAIRNREKLSSLIVEDYERPMETHFNTVEIETDNATVEQLSREASKLNLTFDEYVRGIFYTTAYEANQISDQKQADFEAYVKENTPYQIGGSHISQELKRKLDGKYGTPTNNGLFGLSMDTYTNMLIDLANEYFGLKKQ